MKTLSAALAGGMLWCTAAVVPAYAQDYPSDTVTMFVGYSAGGQADALARAVGDALGQKLGATVVVENKPGANGLLAAQTVAQGDADGYQLLFVTDAMMTIEPQLAESQQWDAKGNLTPVIQLAESPLVVGVNTETAANTVGELVEAAKADGDTLTFGTSGTATPHRMAGEAIGKTSGAPVKNVSYKGTSAAVTDLAGGQLDMVIGSTTAFKPLIDAGKVKLIGNFDDETSPLDPSVPLVDASLPGIEHFDIWYGVTVANGTPPEIVEKLNATLNEILADPAMAETFATVGVTPTGGTPEDFTADVEADFAQRGAILEELGLKAGS
jgi:tripartite-type tricarboxylate transporter receptor subunit TctC